MLEANGLSHHVLQWNSKGAKGTVVLAHGFLDMAWSFRDLGSLLQSQGYDVISFDWRGHGQTEWIGRGGYYHFPDYVRDLEDLTRLLCGDAPFHLVGHSMGGTICTMYAGLRSERLKTLSLLEGLGPPAHDPKNAPEKFSNWLSTVDARRKKEKRPTTLQRCIDRMAVQNPQLKDNASLASFLAEKATKDVTGGRLFRFDPMHQTTSPMPFQEDIFASFAKQISVPTLSVVGGKGYRLKNEAQRLGYFESLQQVEIPDVGHMMHWFEPKVLADHLLHFFAQ